ncbi:hypothetical protein [Flavobacterium rivuli]|uniref:hypothetical protein n=1 Tax=Flavobacterium rivuli TaxID=498301 RepID=UPI00039B40EA|nr:hypothetical protein [Flavobacterium rivuli]
MKKSQTIDSFGNVQGRDMKYMHYQSFNRKDTIMTYIQLGVASLIVLLVCIGLYGLSK